MHSVGWRARICTQAAMFQRYICHLTFVPAPQQVGCHLWFKEMRRRFRDAVMERHNASKWKNQKSTLKIDHTLGLTACPSSTWELKRPAESQVPPVINFWHGLVQPAHSSDANCNLSTLYQGLLLISDKNHKQQIRVTFAVRVAKPLVLCGSGSEWKHKHH